MELKKEYLKPTIVITSIDNEIALILESEPPIGPQETLNIFSTITHQIFKV